MKNALTATAIFFAISMPAMAAEMSVARVNPVAECQSVDVPDGQLAKCAADLKSCMKHKSVEACRAELFSPDQG